MQNFLGVTLLDGSCQLLQHLPDNFFRNEVAFFATLLYQPGYVTSFAKLHDNLYFLVGFVDYPVFLLDYVLVVQFTQNVHFVYQLLSFFMAHFVITNFFPHIYFPVFLMLHFVYLAE